MKARARDRMEKSSGKGEGRGGFETEYVERQVKLRDIWEVELKPKTVETS